MSGEPVQFLTGDGGEWSVAAPMGVADVRLHGAAVPFAARGQRIDLSGHVVADPAGGGRSEHRRRRCPDPSGRLTALRPAIAAIPSPPPVDLVMELPQISRPAGSFPLATVAMAGMTAGVAALFFSPIFALLAGVSALAVVGRWAGSILAHRRSTRQRLDAVLAGRVAWSDAAQTWAAAEGEARHQAALTPHGLTTVFRGETSPWWERLEDDDVLTLCAGIGAIEVEVPVADHTGIESVVARVERRVDLTSVPIEVAFEPGVAVCGDRSETLAAMRWLLGSAISRIGPADVGVVLVTTADRSADWDQLKWAPSLVACVVVDVDREDALTDAFEVAGRSGGRPNRPVLVVVDGAEPTGSGLLARVLSGRVERVIVLWMGSPDAVPAGCRCRVSVAADGGATLDRLDLGGSTAQPFRWFGFSADEWGQSMRWLAGFDDPECVAAGEGLPPAAALSDLVIAPGDGAGEPSRFAAVLERRWASASTQRLTAPIGVDLEGAVEIDLVVDGPHMLAAGTTGAGKSEMLRTLVVGIASEQPPDVVSFVLIDFKGGGAFDLIAPLPHVAAVVTDLDPGEASRALRGLRAEILDREHRLRDMEISDVSEIDRSHHRSFGRMVVVVDEFAALADELPEFLDGLVDIARRGRSLGVHLVLATQRPSGVVTGQIRANTNLRLCLRVQDRSDSIDVIDDSMAGLLPPIPGRAVLRRGAGRLQQLQVAQVSGARRRPTAEPFSLHPCVPVSATEVLVARAVAASLEVIGGDAPRAASLVDQIVDAASGVERAVAPWTTAPLTTAFPVVAPLGLAGVPAQVDGAAIGLLDDPDRRLVAPLEWQPDADGLLVVGADETQIAKTASTAVAAALDRDPSVPTFILDGSRSGSEALARLGDLEPVIDIIGGAEPERLLRAVEHLERTNEPRLIVIHDWTALADALVDFSGPLGAERLTKLVRRAGTPGTAIVVTSRSDRDVPQRASGALGRRVIHRLSDPAGFLSFGLRPADVGSLDGASCVEPGSGLVGVIADLDAAAITALAMRVASDGSRAWPSPIRVLGARVDRAVLPEVESLPEGWRVPVGLGIDMAPHWIVVAPQRPVVVLAHPGGGRTTALTTISGALGERACVIDDADRLDEAELAKRIAAAEQSGCALVVGCTPAHAKRFGSAVAELLQRSTVMLLNPSRNEGDLVRLALPDLTEEPVGRAVSVDRGRATIVQIAA